MEFKMSCEGSHTAVYTDEGRHAFLKLLSKPRCSMRQRSNHGSDATLAL